MNQEAERLTHLRDRLIKGIMEQIEDTQLNGHPSRRLPNNVNISVSFIEGESILLALDLEGICVSTGSACSSSSGEPSHVLLAIGLPPEQARGSLRLTLGKWTTVEEIERVLEILPRIVAKLRAMSPLSRSSGTGFGRRSTTRMVPMDEKEGEAQIRAKKLMERLKSRAQGKIR